MGISFCFFLWGTIWLPPGVFPLPRIWGFWLHSLEKVTGPGPDPDHHQEDHPTSIFLCCLPLQGYLRPVSEGTLGGQHNSHLLLPEALQVTGGIIFTTVTHISPPTHQHIAYWSCCGSLHRIGLPPFNTMIFVFFTTVFLDCSTFTHWVYGLYRVFYYYIFFDFHYYYYSLF